ncbi:MAG: alpha/beta fold hydrolase [bacterium]
MESLRIYGKAPFKIAVIHGGPGAPGQMAPVARELSGDWGILEPFQKATSLEGQVREMKEILEENGKPPFTLIGSSWGAMLSLIFSSRHPGFTNKIILIGSGVYEEKYSSNILETRLNRLSKAERMEAHSMMEAINDPAIQDKNTPMTILGRLFMKSDSYNPLSMDSEALECQYHIYKNVWQEVKELRMSGKLLDIGKRVQCPVVAIHGDYDPHPPEGVQRPLSRILKDFQFFLLKNCGHYPWNEMEARDEFYKILKNQLC